MAPGNKDRHPSHTGTIPKTKVRNNCNVPQEAVTPTRRDMASNLVSTALDWVPVSEYNPRSSNSNQSRKQTNNTSDQDFTDLDNSVAFESGFGRFVPVRPQPRALPLTVQNREHHSGDRDNLNDDASSSGSHSLHPYAHQMQNGLIPHSNHAAAAVMIVNPTTPNTVAGNMPQTFTAQNQNRKNFARNLNSNRHNFEGNNNSNNNTASNSNSRSSTKAVNMMNNMYDQGQGSFNNINENNHVNRESARALGEAIVAVCPDAASVERRLGQIREYIRVTSSLVDTMRNSEDEAFVEHTKQEYDELLEMIEKLKESEQKLEILLLEKNSEAFSALEDPPQAIASEEESQTQRENETSEDTTVNCLSEPNVPAKKVTNIENEQINKTNSLKKINEDKNLKNLDQSETSGVEIKEIETHLEDIKKDDEILNEMLKKNIKSCTEKIAIIEDMKSITKDANNNDEKQDVVVRPVSVQSNGSAYSENELWQNEIKNKMEMSQMRLSALKQQQKMLIKYQEEAKQQLEELNKQSQEMHHPSTSHENFSNPQNVNANYTNSNRMYATNQIGVATTLPQDVFSNETRSNHSQHQDDRFSIRDGNIASSEEAGHRSDAEEDAEGVLQERGRMLHRRLRDLQLKKQHMENLVTEFQKLQMAASMGVAHNTYSSSGEDSGEDEPSRKCNKSGVNMKNEDPFKLMEIKAIKTALQKTKDLMRSVETFEADHLSGTTEDTFHMPSHSNNIHDNKSESGSVGGWSGEGSVCRVLNSLPHRHKFTNEHSGQNHSQRTQNHVQNRQMQPQQSHEANINSLQELAQELRMETEKIMGERARIKDLVSNKVAEANRKPKKVNEEVSVPCPGPAERRQMQLRALLAEKQRELELLLNKEVMNVSSELPQVKADSRAVSVANQSYSEPEEAESSEHIQIDSQNSRETENFRGGGDSALGSRSNTAPSQHASAYCSDTDSASRGKSNQRNRQRRRTQDRLEGNEHLPQNNCVNNSRHEPRPEPNNMTPPASQHVDNATNMPYPHMPPPCWNSKSNQDMRANQFTQNSHSQTMERLLGTPQMTFPPSMPFNMMMPFGGVMCGCACGCSCSTWGAWCWQQILMQQRDIHHMRQQINHLEERWRAETASHTLNNQVPPGNRANNYWDNFRSYSRQNLLSTNSKTNADGPSSTNPPLERSHNTLRRGSAQASPCATPKRNTNDPRAEEQMRNSQANVAYERSLSFSSAPDVLNLNQNEDTPVPRNQNDSAANINRQEAANRNLNITNPIPEIIQSHSNLNKKKSSAKLPSKNSANRRNYNVLDFSQTSNINIASTSEANTTSQEIATSRLFDILRESIYSEVTTLIGVNESHPDFLIQLFKELTHISSDRLRQRVLQAIRQISQYNAAIENQTDSTQEEYSMEAVTTTSTEHDNYCDVQNGLPQIDNRILRFLVVKSEDIFTPELLEAFANIVINNANDNRHAKKLLESLLKYEGMRVCDVSTDIIENLPAMIGVEEDNHHSEISEPNLQDVAGSLSLFGSSDTQMHQINGCPYIWPGHVHMDMDSTDTNNSQEGKSDLITCSEMLNGDLAEADQTCRSDVSENAGNRQDGDGGNAEALPDVIDTEEVTPTEAEAEWLGLDRVPTRLHMEDKSEKQKD